MPKPAFLLLVATLLPLVSFGLLLFVGRRLGSPVAGWVATLFLAASFLCTLLAMYTWYLGGKMDVPGPAGPVTVRWGYPDKYDKGPIDLPVRWLPVGTAGSGPAAAHPGWLDLGLYVDSLTIAMFAMVTLISLLVHWFSVGYLRDDPRFPRFFAYLGLFCFSMLGLALGGTLLQVFVFWELVGLCSYLLIGFWYEKPSAANAAVKAFVTNRVGDVGFLIGFGLLFHYLGNASLPHLWLALGRAGLGEERGGPLTLADGTVIPAAVLTLTGIALFCGAMGKSAQFPLHVWLADAMEGPTPASALIHAATMVAAGVYLLGRVFPILTPGARLFIAVIGLTTLTTGALIAAVQSDIKRVLAFSTVSQLGYMTLAMGVGSWVGGLFHLMTHGFFKALLFLGAGGVILAAGHEQEMPRFGGLMRRLPVTAFTFAVATLAVAGVPPFSGYYSKDMILRHAGAFAALASSRGASGWYWIFFVVPAAVACLTAFYMTRCWMLTFWGRPRDAGLYERARESPGLWLWVPLLTLAGGSIIAGNWLSIPDLLQGSMRETQVICQRLAASDPSGFYRGRRFEGFRTAWPGPVPGEGDRSGSETGPPAPGGADAAAVSAEAAGGAAAEMTESQKAHARGELLVRRFVTPMPFVGIALAVVLYLRGPALAARLVRAPPLRRAHHWLYHRMYFDELYFSVFVAATMLLSRFSAWLDRHVIDGLVNLTGRLVRGSAAGAGAGDRYVIDGAVNGVGRLARDVGAAARAPQTGRIRLYVTLMAAVAAVGVAVMVVVVLVR